MNIKKTLVKIEKGLNKNKRFKGLINKVIEKDITQSREYLQKLSIHPKSGYEPAFQRYTETLRYIRHLERLKAFKISSNYLPFLEDRLTHARKYLQNRVQTLEDFGTMDRIQLGLKHLLEDVGEKFEE
jgi:hypothetical protein